MSGGPRWRFRRMVPAEINQDPVQGEFFTSASDLAERLVRESLQNSLDARSGADAVTVRFAFSQDSLAIPPSDAVRYLDGLAAHLRSDTPESAAEREAVARAQECLRMPMTWLTIEDFGTTGLSGDIKGNDPKEPGNHFWGFFRSVGISPKGEDAGGSWGLGKWVFPDASMINAYLGATRRTGEDRTLLMGMAVLKTHTIEGAKHPPYGQFAARTDARDDVWLPTPIDSGTDPGFVETALSDFGLGRRDSPGLSVIVPFPKAELTPGAVARSVITQYFLPIVRGDLVVEISSPGQRTRVISAETISREVMDIHPISGAQARERDEESPQSLAGVIRLAEWAVGAGGSDLIRMPVPTRGSVSLSDSQLRDLRSRYERGDRMAFEFGTSVLRRGETERTDASFRLYLERDDELAVGHDYFVRGHLSMPRMDHVQHYKARALVTVAAESELAHLLRDSEGPAHVQWNPHEQRLKDNWVGGYQRVQDVRRAAAVLLQRLVERPGERQHDALADLFPADPADIAGRGRSGRRGRAAPQPEGSPRALASPLDVRRIGSGFVVSASRQSEVTGSEWILRFAYDVVRGNPFTAYERGVRDGIPDFSAGSGRIEVVGRLADVVPLSANEVRFRALSEKFAVEVSGFDSRDVIVDLVRADPADGPTREDMSG